jgi:hypothetical protein
MTFLIDCFAPIGRENFLEDFYTIHVPGEFDAI